jgi:anthranilate phosphoribosyltransferase
MKHAAPVRKALGVRTLFNLLGPLTNPAGAKRQLMGVFSEDLTETIAAVLGRLGATRAMVVCSKDGLDEITITAPTRVSEFRDGRVRTRTVRPEDFGLARVSLAELIVDSAEQSAAMIRQVLAGTPGPARDILVLNAAAALTVAELAQDILAGMRLAEESIDSGRAAKALDKLVVVSNS